MRASTTLALSAALALAVLPAQAQGYKVDSPQGSLKFGVLFQPQFESVGDRVKDGSSQNVFMRRFRFLASGSFGDNLEFFFETDSPNLGKSDATGTKTTDKLMLQDAFVSWKINKDTRLDVGLVLVPFAHHSTQGATTLLTWDYSPYAFLQSALIGSNVGRDTGIQLRGLAFKHLEYRVGAFQGKRTAAIDGSANPENNRLASRNALRTAGRLQWNFLDNEGGTFLGGTYLGAKKIVSIGVGHDRQDEYKATAFDVFVDLPLGSNGVTFQANHYDWDGGKWINLPKQKTLFTEAGYRIGKSFMPMIRYETRKPEKATATLPEETRIGAGIAWWLKGHTSNLKLHYTRVKSTAAGVANLKAYDQWNLQWQALYF